MTRELPPWRGCATPPPLGREPHLWRADLVRCRSDESLLQDSERTRARRFAFEEDRRHFIAEHGLRRRLLAAYLATDPATLTVEPDPMGKPRLRDGSLSFSGSESGGKALFAVARSGELGVDIERIRPERADLRFAERYFHPLETAAIAKLQGDDRVRAFFATWTRKEALVKAVGTGLRIPLASFRVGVLPEEASGPLAYETDWPAARDWRLLPLALGADSIGALALGADLPDPVLLDWTGD